MPIPPTHFTFILNLSFILCSFLQGLIIFSVKALLFWFVRPIFSLAGRSVHLSVQGSDAATRAPGLSYLFGSIKQVTISVIPRVFSSHRLPTSSNLLLQKWSLGSQKSFGEGLLFSNDKFYLNRVSRAKAAKEPHLSLLLVVPQVLIPCVSYTCNKACTHSAYFYIKIHKTGKNGRGLYLWREYRGAQTYLMPWYDCNCCLIHRGV